LRAEIVGPNDHLRGQAHDQHQRRIGSLSERFVTEPYAVSVNEIRLASLDLIR
jgi:hypothetical protein